MKIDKRRLEEFQGGWFIGNFDPSVLKTNDFEISIKVHPKGEIWPKHYHKIATEYNCIIEGKVEIDNIIYIKNDIFIIHPGYIVDPIFHEDCTIVCVKTPCVIGDKYEVPR